MRFTEDGLVEGGIQCGFKDENGSPHVETVFDLEEWIRRRVGEFSERDVYREFLWIGSMEEVRPFAELSRNDTRQIKVRYGHPAFAQTVGFFTVAGTFESTSVNKIAHDILSKASRVDLHNW